MANDEQCSSAETQSFAFGLFFFVSSLYGFVIDFAYVETTQGIFQELRDLDGIELRGWLEGLLIGLLCLLFGKEQYREAIDKLRLHHPLSFRPIKDVATVARFVFNTCIIIIIQAVILSAVVGMVNEAVVNGSTDRTPESVLGTSAVLFAFALASAIFGVMTKVHGIVSGVTSAVAVASPAHATALKQHIGNDWIPRQWFFSGEQFASKTRVQARSPIGLLPVGAGLAAGGALLLSVAVGASYYDIAVAFDEVSVGDPVLDTGASQLLHSGVTPRSASGEQHLNHGEGQLADSRNSDNDGLLWVPDPLESSRGAPSTGLDSQAIPLPVSSIEDGFPTRLQPDRRLLWQDGSNSTKIESRLDRRSANIVRDLFLVRLAAVSVPLSFFLFLVVFTFSTGLYKTAQLAAACDNDGRCFAQCCMSLCSTCCGTVMLLAVSGCLVLGLGGAGAIAGAAFALWVSRSLYSSASRYGSKASGAEARLEAWEAKWLGGGLKLCLPRILSNKELEEGASSADVRTIRRLHAPLIAAGWTWRFAMLSAVLDLVLGIFALASAPISRALNSELLEGYQIGIVCAMMGTILCGLAVPMLAWVQLSGVLSVTGQDDAGSVQEQLQRSFYPAVLSADQAAALKHDEALAAFAGNMSREQLEQQDKSERDDGGVGMIELDASDVVEIPGTSA